MSDTHFRLRFTVAGGHVHCRLFSSRRGYTNYAKNGDLVFSKGAEFRDFVLGFKDCDVIPDDETSTMQNACEP